MGLTMEQLVSERPKLFKYALYFTKNEFDAEDLTQEVMIRAIKFASKFEGRSSPSSWMFKIMRNTWNSISRRSRHSKECDIEDVQNLIASSDTGALEMLLMDETLELVTSVLSSEAPRSREAFFLRFVDGWSYDEIATCMNSNRSCVGVTLMRTRDKIRDRLRVRMEK